MREAPASFDDHFSQARLFWLSMTPVEQEHIVAAYTFELGKCYEQAIKERQLRALANIDADLCAQVAAGLGLPAPEPTEALTSTSTPARRCPRSATPGRPTAGSSASSSTRAGDLDGVDGGAPARSSAAGMVPLVIAPAGGKLARRAWPSSAPSPPPGPSSSTPLLVAGAGRPARTPCPARDSKAGRAVGPGARPAGRAAAAGGLPPRQGDRRLGRRRAGARGALGVHGGQPRGGDRGQRRRGLRGAARGARRATGSGSGSQPPWSDATCTPFGRLLARRGYRFTVKAMVGVVVLGIFAAVAVIYVVVELLIR